MAITVGNPPTRSEVQERREALRSIPRNPADIRADRISERERQLWADLAVVSYEVLTAKCLNWSREYRSTDSQGRVHITPADYSGTAALTALRNEDFATFGKLVHAAVSAEIREQAEEWADEQEQDARDAKAIDGAQR